MNDLRNRIVKIALDVVCLSVVGIPVLTLYVSGKSYRRGFYCDDESIRYPFKESTVTSTVLYLYGVFIPTIVISVTEFLRFSRRKTSMSQQQWLDLSWIIYNEMVVFIFGALSSQLCTDIAKYTIGRLRPHFLDVCKPIDMGSLCPSLGYNHVYIENYSCSPTADPNKIREARLSFMSGHSSFSAYTMVFTAIYLQHKMKWQSLSLVRPLLQVTLIYLSIYTGLSRISDYKHHWSDVLVGLIQGTLLAILTTVFVGRTWRRQITEKLGNDTVTPPANRTGNTLDVTISNTPSATYDVTYDVTTFDDGVTVSRDSPPV